MKLGAVPCGAAPFLSVNNDTKISYLRFPMPVILFAKKGIMGYVRFLRIPMPFSGLFREKKSWEKSVP